ncbi:MAG: adenylyltransferase/cytidyltransferase family protein, partial [Patescibacteria group bacterium]
MIKRTLVFGTFDGFDAGHHGLLEQASKLGHELIVVVARDRHVRFLKKKEPVNTQKMRLARVQKDPRVTRALLSDVQLGTYHI